MPNWCECDLKVSGSLTELDRFIKQASGPYSCLDANRFIPYPKLFEMLDELNLFPSSDREMSDEEIGILTLVRLSGLDISKDGYSQGGYDWCRTNWGVKWNIEAQDYKRNKRTITYEFATAWSPPCNLVIAMGEQFPKLFFTLEYYEGGSAFQGKLKIKGGIVIEDSTSLYHGTRGG